MKPKRKQKPIGRAGIFAFVGVYGLFGMWYSIDQLSGLNTLRWAEETATHIAETQAAMLWTATPPPSPTTLPAVTPTLTITETVETVLAAPQPLIDELRVLPGVVELQSVQVFDDEVYVNAEVAEPFHRKFFAEVILGIVLRHIPNAPGFVAILQTGSRETLYDWQASDGEWNEIVRAIGVTSTPLPAPTAMPQQQQNAGQPPIRPVRPGNCATAVAIGMSPEEAARAGLDRDHDGVACYGD